MIALRNFLKSIVAAVALAAIPIGLKKPMEVSPTDDESPYEELLRFHMQRHAEEIERAFLYGGQAETAFGTLIFKRHPLFEA